MFWVFLPHWASLETLALIQSESIQCITIEVMCFRIDKEPLGPSDLHCYMVLLNCIKHPAVLIPDLKPCSSSKACFSSRQTKVIFRFKTGTRDHADRACMCSFTVQKERMNVGESCFHPAVSPGSLSRGLPN